MICYHFAPTRRNDHKLIDRLFDNLMGIVTDSINPLKKGQVFGFEFHADANKARFAFLLPDVHEDHLIEGLRYTYKGAGFSISERFVPVEKAYPVAISLRSHPFSALLLSPKGEFHERLLQTFEGFKGKEQVWGQILLEPVYSDWHQDFQLAYKDYLHTGDNFGGVGVKKMMAVSLRKLADMPKNALAGMSQSEDERYKPHRLKDAELKMTKPGMKTCVRLYIEAEETRRQTIANSVLASFRTMNNENEWQSETIMRKKAFRAAWTGAEIPRFGAVILCEDELRMFFQMSDTPSHKLTQMTPEEKVTDPRVTKKGVMIGHTYSFGKQGDPIYYVTDPVDDFVRQRLYIAPPGGGKTTQIYVLWNQIARLGYGGALWDVADGTLFHKAMESIDERDAKRIVAFDYTNERNPPIFNFSALAGSGDDASQMFAELFDVLFDGESLTRSKSFMQKAAMTTFAFPEHQFLEFVQVMRDDEFRKTILPKLRDKNPDMYLWWMREFPRISENELTRMIAPILDRCDQLLHNPRLKCMMNGRGGGQTPRAWMDKNMLVHYNVSGGRFSEHEQRIIMAMHNQAYWSATLSRENLTVKGVRPIPFFLMYDEPQTYINSTPMFRRAISKARKYSVGCNFFIQDSEQLMAENKAFWLELLGVKPHIMAGHISEATAKQLLREYRPLTLDQMLEVENFEHTWWLKTYAEKKSVAPILVRTLNPDDLFTPRNAQGDIARSVLEYHRHTGAQVSEDISARSLRLSPEEYRKALHSFDEPQEGVAWEPSAEAVRKGKK